MVEVVWTRRAINELSAINDYLGERNPAAAARTVNAIYRRTQNLLTANPFIGRPGDISGTRELVVPRTPYIVAYRVTEGRVEVLFVQHGAREWPETV